MRRDAAVVVASILAAAVVSGCADSDPAEPYAREGCEAWVNLESDDPDADAAAIFRMGAEHLDDAVRPLLASAAKRSDAYADAHEAAVELSGAMSAVASAAEAGSPSDSDVDRFQDAYDALTAECVVVLAD